MASHPDDHLLQLFGERPAFLVTDPNTAGVYDTVYVDLDDDYQFADEKPVTKDSPASYRDMNGDGYNDLSGGLLYFISDGETVLRAASCASRMARRSSVTPSRSARARCSPGAVTSTRPSRATARSPRPTSSARASSTACAVRRPCRPTGAQPCSGGGTLSRRRHRRCAEREACSVRRHLLLLRVLDPVRLPARHEARDRRDVELLRLLGADNDGYDAASQEADLIYNGSTRTTPVFSTGNGAPGFGTATAPQPLAGIAVGASTQFGGTGWDSIKNDSQITDNDVVVWSNRGPGPPAATASTSSPTAPTRPATDPEHVTRRPRRLGDLGRHQPLDAGGRRRDRARLPGVAAVTRRHDPDELLHDRQAHREVVRAGPRLRELHPGRGLGGRGPGSPGRLRHRRVRRPGQVAARQLPRDGVPGLHADALARRSDYADVHGQRAGDVDGLRPLHEADGVAVHDVHELQS